MFSHTFAVHVYDGYDDWRVYHLSMDGTMVHRSCTKRRYVIVIVITCLLDFEFDTKCHHNIVILSIQLSFIAQIYRDCHNRPVLIFGKWVSRCCVGVCKQTVHPCIAAVLDFEVCMYACMYVCVHACMYVCTHICMYACVCICMFVYAGMYVYAYICTYVCICV